MAIVVGLGFLLLLLVLVVGGAIIWAVGAARKEREWRAKLAAFAAANRWNYVQQDNNYRGRFLGLPFSLTRMANINNIFTGTHRGRYLFACEFVYTTSSGDTQQTHYYTVVAVATPAARPTLQVTRENTKTGLLDTFGIRDLQLESTAFNDAYYVKTENERFAYDVLHPRMMEFLLADQRAWRWPFRFERSDLVTWESGRLDPNKLLWMLDFMSDIADRVPEFIWK